MKKDSIKNTRINSEVMKVLAELIRSEIKDPRVPAFTSVTDVIVAPDLKTCKVWVSFLCDEEQEKEFGIAKNDFVAQELKYIKQMRFKAKVQLGKQKTQAYVTNLRDRIVAACSQSMSLQELLLQRYPAVNFRKLETLSEADLKQLSEDMELINLIEEVEDAEQSTGESR